MTATQLPFTAPTCDHHQTIPELSNSSDMTPSDGEIEHERIITPEKTITLINEAGPSKTKTPQTASHNLQQAQMGRTKKLPPLTTKQRITKRLLQAQARVLNGQWLEGLHCCLRPLGSCTLLSLAGSAYCSIHSCTAINADGSTCYNEVEEPGAHYCKHGWHEETNRGKPVRDLIEHRKQADRMAQLIRSNELLSHSTYFEEHFSSQSSASSKSAASPCTKPIAIPGRNDRQEERGWGAHGVDKWWVGEWNKNQLRAGDRNCLGLEH